MIQGNLVRVLDLWARARRAGWARARRELWTRLQPLVTLWAFRLRRPGRRVRRGWARLCHGPAVPVIRADLLGGDHIWVTLDVPDDGHFAAVGRAGERVTFSNHVESGFRTVQLAVDELGGCDAGAWSLKFHAAGKDRRLVLAEDLEPAPTVPVLDGGRPWTHRVVDSGSHLTVRRTAVAQRVDVLGLGVEGRSLEVMWSASSGSELLLLGRGVPPVVVPAEVDGTYAVARIGVDLPLPGRTADLALRTTEGDLPLARAHHDLRHPNAVLVLPEVASAEGTLRFRWSEPDGLLQVRR